MATADELFIWGATQRTVQPRMLKRRMVVMVAVVGCAALGCSGDTGDDEDSQEDLPACLPPGSYSLSWSVISDTCGGIQIPTELITIRNDGTAAGSPAPPDGCEDSRVSDVDCVRDFQRECRFPVADGAYLEADYSFVMDLVGKIASVHIDARGYENGTLEFACAASARGTISML